MEETTEHVGHLASVFDGTRLTFEQSGTYRLKVRVTDQMGVSNICQVYITCNE